MMELEMSKSGSAQNTLNDYVAGNQACLFFSALRTINAEETMYNHH